MSVLNKIIKRCKFDCQLYTATTVKIKNFLAFFFFVFLFFQSAGNSYGSFETEFPTYKVIKGNVDFWEKVYGHYSHLEGIVHDKDDLKIIYEVIPQLDKQLPGAARINKVYRKETLKKYETLLKNIIQQGKPKTSEEKRVYNLFSGSNKLKKIKIAADNIRIQIGLKEKFREGVVRSGKYLNEIQRVFIGHGLPLELSYLPHVESSFINNAHSKAGAQGIWQFTRSTGKQYLTINNEIDERKDPIIAADAAAKYLKKSYLSLGTWPLAITSYNYGPAGMKRAQEAKGSYEKIFSHYKEGYFKFASRNFYPEFIAAYNVATTLERDTRITKDKPQKYHYLTLPNYISIAAVARHFKLPDRILAEYNPALLSPILKGEKYIPKGYRLRLPDTQRVVTKLHSIPHSSFKKKQKPGGYYTVKRGDTAGGIAYKHRITLTRLIQANNLDPQAAVYIGQKLRIPQ